MGRECWTCGKDKFPSRGPTPEGTQCPGCAGGDVLSFWCKPRVPSGGDPVLAVEHWEHSCNWCGREWAALSGQEENDGDARKALFDETHEAVWGEKNELQ